MRLPSKLKPATDKATLTLEDHSQIILSKNSLFNSDLRPE